MPDELTAHRLSTLETAVSEMGTTLKSVDRSLQRLTTIQETHDKILNEQSDIKSTVAQHSERLDSHRWALRLIIGSVIGGFIAAIWAVIT